MSTQLSIYAKSKKTGEKMMLAYFSTTPARYMDNVFHFVYEIETSLTIEDVNKLIAIYEKDAKENKGLILERFASVKSETMILMNAKSIEMSDNSREILNNIYDYLDDNLEDLEDSSLNLGRLYCVYNFMDNNKDQFDFSYTYC